MLAGIVGIQLHESEPRPSWGRPEHPCGAGNSPYLLGTACQRSGRGPGLEGAAMHRRTDGRREAVRVARVCHPASPRSTSAPSPGTHATDAPGTGVEPSPQGRPPPHQERFAVSLPSGWSLWLSPAQWEGQTSGPGENRTAPPHQGPHCPPEAGLFDTPQSHLRIPGPPHSSAQLIGWMLRSGEEAGVRLSGKHRPRCNGSQAAAGP